MTAESCRALASEPLPDLAWADEALAGRVAVSPPYPTKQAAWRVRARAYDRLMHKVGGYALTHLTGGPRVRFKTQSIAVTDGWVVRIESQKRDRTGPE